MKKILLCAPKFYDIEYEINPWMNINNKVDKKKAMEEYEALNNTYLSLGAEVLDIDPVDGLPDMVYAANLGSPFGNKFVVASFKYEQRRGESAYAKAYFEKLGFETINLPDGIFFEGQGDLLKTNGKFFLGWGKRSSRQARDFLTNKLGIEFIHLELVDPYYYHLDMSLGPIDSKTVLIKPESFTKEGLSILRNEFPNIIEVGEEDNQLMACNLVVVDKTVVMAKGISDKLKNDIKKYGFDVKEMEMTEFRKGGGSIKCLTLEFY